MKRRKERSLYETNRISTDQKLKTYIYTYIYNIYIYIYPEEERGKRECEEKTSPAPLGQTLE